jgi:hypothetical protein
MKYRQALHRTKQGNKATARAMEAPRLSDHHQKGALKMAELTVPKFFTIEQKVEDGLDLDGTPKQYDVEKCTTTRRAVEEALRQIGLEHPELHDCMRVAAAMLVRLDTIRDGACPNFCVNGSDFN